MKRSWMKTLFPAVLLGVLGLSAVASAAPRHAPDPRASHERRGHRPDSLSRREVMWRYDQNRSGRLERWEQRRLDRDLRQGRVVLERSRPYRRG